MDSSKEKPIFEFIRGGGEKKNIKTIDRPRSIDRSDIEEALEWNKLFREGWVTAHDLRELSTEATPKEEGEIFKVEIKNLIKIKEVLEEDLSDEDFKNKIPEIRALLPKVFEEMEGLEQSGPHGNCDPTDHTINALGLLETENLEKRDRMIARLAIIFHDTGKVYDAQSRVHSRRSEKIAKNYLDKMGVNKEDQVEILAQVKYHDLLGEATRRDGHNIFDHRDVLLKFPSQRELDIHYKIAKADIGSISGLSKFLPDIEKTYRLMTERMTKRERWIEVEVLDLPFEEVGSDLLIESWEELFEEEIDFDSVNVEEDMKYRRVKFEGGVYEGKRFKKEDELKAEFEGLSDDKRENIERLVIQYALGNDRKLLFAIKLLGRETDLNYLEKLEKKYELRLDNLRIAINIHILTYRLWELNFEVSDEILSENDTVIKDIEKKLFEISEAVDELSNFSIKATHATDTETRERLERNLSIDASDSRYGDHYEGDGVYLGMLKSYGDWKSAVLKTKVALSDTLPIITSYTEPMAMANVLSEYLDFFPDDDEVAVPRGLAHWRQCAYDEGISEWKLKSLEKILGSEARLALDDDGDECVVMDTNENPIVWGALCRALKIRRFIPKKELRKFGLKVEYQPRVRTVKIGDKWVMISSDEGLAEEVEYEYYVNLAKRAVRAKGVKMDEIKNY